MNNKSLMNKQVDPSLPTQRNTPAVTGLQLSKLAFWVVVLLHLSPDLIHVWACPLGDMTDTSL